MTHHFSGVYPAHQYDTPFQWCESSTPIWHTIFSGPAHQYDIPFSVAQHTNMTHHFSGVNPAHQYDIPFSVAQHTNMTYHFQWPSTPIWHTISVVWIQHTNITHHLFSTPKWHTIFRLPHQMAHLNQSMVCYAHQKVGTPYLGVHVTPNCVVCQIFGVTCTPLFLEYIYYRMNN